MADIPKNFMQGYDKALVEQKLREMGMKDVAQKLSRLSEEDIKRLVLSNPEVIKKASEIIKGGKINE